MRASKERKEQTLAKTGRHTKTEDEVGDGQRGGGGGRWLAVAVAVAVTTAVCSVDQLDRKRLTHVLET